ncbi:hypothetical protein OOJ96_24300 [Pseudomonas sp. 15FMM2]|uniref:Uncharacterized protein n=1 Tax=Pseudomonas imrae TaxID=2992837 RepID=A0ACC7PJG8_9PSED
MGTERQRRDSAERDGSRDEHEEEKPQTWKHPDDGKELSERDEERPLKP